MNPETIITTLSETNINGLKIKVSSWGSVSFNNDKNSFWVTPDEIKRELNRDNFYNSLKFVCKLTQISDPITLLKRIEYPFDKLNSQINY